MTTSSPPLNLLKFQYVIPGSPALQADSTIWATREAYIKFTLLHYIKLQVVLFIMLIIFICFLLLECMLQKAGVFVSLFVDVSEDTSVMSLSHVWLFVTPWTTACQAILSITNSWSLPELMSIELVMPSNHLILCCPLLLLPSIFPRIIVFSNESALPIRWPK